MFPEVGKHGHVDWKRNVSATMFLSLPRASQPVFLRSRALRTANLIKVVTNNSQIYNMSAKTSRHCQIMNCNAIWKTCGTKIISHKNNQIKI